MHEKELIEVDLRDPALELLDLPVIGKGHVNYLVVDGQDCCVLHEKRWKHDALAHTSYPLRSSVAMAARLAEKILSVETNGEGHLSCVCLTDSQGIQELQLDDSPKWPISLEIRDEHFVLHFSSRGRRFAAIIDTDGKIRILPPWHLPLARNDGQWFVQATASSANEVPTQSTSYEHITWMGEAGIEMGAWLSRSQGSTRGAVLLHGGPTSACDDPRNRWARLLSECGFCVLQPNLPGSIGYGDEVVRALRAESWIRQIHNEVQGAANVLSKHTGISPDRMVVVGESFGGYLALFAGAKTISWHPAGIVSINGFADLRRDRQLCADTYRKYMESHLGSPGEDDNLYALASPSTWLHRDTPHFALIASQRDGNVAFANSEQLHSDLPSGKSQLISLPDSSHGSIIATDWDSCQRQLKLFFASLPQFQPLGLETHCHSFHGEILPLFKEDLFSVAPRSDEHLVIRCIRGLAFTNQCLWQLEDESRNPDRSLREIDALNRRIDQVNQRRNDLIDDIDLLLVKQGSADSSGTPARYRTVSLGSALDRLTILSIRRSVLNKLETEAVLPRVEIAKTQAANIWERLYHAIEQYINDIISGEASRAEQESVALQCPGLEPHKRES